MNFLALMCLKGGPARSLFQSHPNFRKLYRTGHFWSRGSFYRSVSNVGSDTVYRYITEHRAKELPASVEAAQKEFEQMNPVSFM